MSHFSTVKTHLRKRKPLLKALNDLGFTPLDDKTSIRGFRGQTVMTDLAVKVEDSGDFGFLWNENNKSFELVTDLDLWKQPIPFETFVSKLTQRYAFNTVIETTQSEGFEITEQKNNLDGSIELVVTRWDS